MMSTTSEVVSSLISAPGMEYTHTAHENNLPSGTANATETSMKTATDSLMQGIPTGDRDVQIERASNVVVDQGNRFQSREKGVQRQFAQIYYARLEMLKRSVKERALKEWGEDAPFVQSILGLELNKKACIIGTIYKEMTMKPNILRDLEVDTFAAVPAPKDKLTDATDKLILEDQAGRINLIGKNLPIDDVVTGVVVACYGIENADGDFFVTSYCFADMAPQKMRELKPEPVDGDTYIGLVSGLNISPQNKNLFPVQMMADYLTGNLGNENENSVVSRVSHLMVLGNSMGPMPKKSEIQAYVSDKNARNSSDDQHFALKELDSIFSEITANTPMIVSPGAHDPSNFSLPQLPMHGALFPNASRHTSWTSVSNPLDVNIAGIDILATSGQPLNDIYKYCNTTDRLSIMENTLRWRHIAPTAPDTLAVYPFQGVDPFVMESTPHVYLAGNQPDFEERIVRGADGQEVHVIALPTFSVTPVLVLMNTRTLRCHPVYFSGPDDDI
ncbi:hypothetical protein SARC_07062 [Sphaeroforma arctica JP610]|uniref:DNA polymerase delta small subunit n=1 Tax=Sphaeroforma arctica JP610 TaxID=667725 RepID=A0A0L0FXB7_9EUKA|nr:hypothetical protein SARC_07062 [Sphaeroforma arctica JP610]KNC80578.1 hypothetical protein SARC_07062 [Sphaeroforma arctica JP610]|eukprot:XP_014154480.1 hypothetical protein SARC_07062 [Sphaeroforma arctica JP610]